MCITFNQNGHFYVLDVKNDESDVFATTTGLTFSIKLSQRILQAIFLRVALLDANFVELLKPLSLQCVLGRGYILVLSLAVPCE